MSDPETYQCKGCGLHYLEKKWAEACRAFCGQFSACDPEIAKHSIELSREKPA
ncbi:MAG TPA: hypothetical protein VLG37_01125 [Candidatus Saccharimonadales bacterium]|nr:hypothetical protein [Candidatus Saccharimonadales bacterium]